MNNVMLLSMAVAIPLLLVAVPSSAFNCRVGASIPALTKTA